MSIQMHRSILNRLAGALMLAVALAGCGGGGSDSAAPATGPQVTRIGATGGTAAGPGGSEAVIPAGALSQELDIGIEASDDGAPPLPTDATRIGTIYAFTPHGTTFAQPVSVTVPFDPAQLPAGSTPALYKTNAGRAGWVAVPGATVNGATMLGSVTGFSNLVVVIPPLIRAEARYEWEFTEYQGNGQERAVPPGLDAQVGGVLSKLVEFGPQPLDLNLRLLDQSLPRDGRANGYVFAQGNGVTYGALSEAPYGVIYTADPIGGKSRLKQLQTFRKVADDATLSFRLTSVVLRLEDYQLQRQRSGELLVASAMLSVGAYPRDDRSHYFYYRGGDVVAFGERGSWNFRAGNFSFSRGTLWDDDRFEQTVEPIAYSNGVQSCVGELVYVRLKQPRTYVIDLSSVATGQEFTVRADVETKASNTKGGGPIEECLASSAYAYLRDPQEVGAPTIEYTGLLPVTTPSTESPPRDAYEPPASCPGGTIPAAGTVQFSAPAFALNERAGSPPTILVTRTGGSTGAVSATFATVDGTAVAGTDYQPVLTTVHFGDGDSATRVVEVPIIPNTLDQADRTVLLTLNEPGGCGALGTPTSAVLVIEDDDPAPVQRFTLGGTVTGLAGSGLVISTTGADPLAIAANGSFRFVETFGSGSTFKVEVTSQPQNPRQQCTVANGEGAFSADVGNVQIACTTLPSSASLDPAFGSGGAAWLLHPGSQPYNHSLAMQADGKLLLVTGSDQLLRVLPNGTPDAGFGTTGNGVVVLPSGHSITHQLTTVAVQPDGRIVVAGTAPNGAMGRPDMLVARYTAAGALDLTFAGGLGVTTFDVSGTWSDGVVQVLLQADGSILLAGVNSDPTGNGSSRFAVLKLTAAGAIDTAWGSSGLANVGVDRFSLTRAAAPTGDGGVVLAGRVGQSGGALADLGLVKFTAAGAPDPTFGTSGDGIVRPLLNGSHEEATDVVVQPDGKIVVLVTSLVRASWLARYLPNGQPDLTFGTNGNAQITTPITGWALALQADGSLWVAGEVGGAGGADYGLVRFTAGGQPDSAFNNGSALVIDFFGGFDTPGALLMQPDGKPVLAGRAASGSRMGAGFARVLP